VRQHLENKKHTNTTLRKVGLARALSKLGYCSRSDAAKLIRSGRVRLNGAVRRNPETPVHLGKDRIEVDRAPVGANAKIYLMLNKPRGVVTSASDEKGRETVYACLPKNHPWVAPVGRLDKASEGLLLLTNDSEWAARITLPETHLDKTYHVQIGAIADDALLEKLHNGIPCDEGEFLRGKRATLLRQGERNCWIEIVLDEGKKPSHSPHVRVLRNRSVATHSRGDWTTRAGQLAKMRDAATERRRETDTRSRYANDRTAGRRLVHHTDFPIELTCHCTLADLNRFRNAKWQHSH
jgi:23S rRNA pseudouridine2605 synthase